MQSALTKYLAFSIKIICMALMMGSCNDGNLEEIPNNERVTFMVINRTGHNGPASTNCGTQPIPVEFTFITPHETKVQIVSGDAQEFIGLRIDEGEQLTVVVKDAETKDELTTKSEYFNPTEKNAPQGVDPLIRLCPVDFLEFKYF